MSKLQCNLDMMYKRRIKEELLQCSKSILLLGPRQTGKSTLIQELSPDLTINLAQEQMFLQFASHPGLLENLIEEKKIKSIFIDEVQRIPSILNTIQSILDSTQKKYKFYLTGSSARKLRRGQANLLPGRVISFFMSPLTLEEISYEEDLKSLLSFGTLPGIMSEKEIKIKKQLLTTYSSTYLKEEIQAEAFTKNIEGFSRFLFVAAAMNGRHVDFAKMGSQSYITQKTATRFFEILEDTLIISRLNAFSRTEYRRLIQHPKFYFFDVGVLNALLGNFQISPDRKGNIFETFIFNQIQSMIHSRAMNMRFSTFRTSSGGEVDFLLEYEDKVLAIEVKASSNVGRTDLTGFQSFSEIYKKPFDKMVVYIGENALKIEGVRILPYKTALQEIIKWLEG